MAIFFSKKIMIKKKKRMFDLPLTYIKIGLEKLQELIQSSPLVNMGTSVS